MIKIVAAGDSFVYGNELLDCIDEYRLNARGGRYYKTMGNSQKTFSALLLPTNEYQCLAKPGYGNDSIARSTINFVEQHKKENIFLIISWTFPGRYEFRFNYNTQQKSKNWYVINPWTIKKSMAEIEQEFFSKNTNVSDMQKLTISTAQQTGIVDFAEVFYKNVGSSEYWEIYSSLKEIVYLQNYLKVNNIPYMFTCADNSILYNYTVKSTDENIQSLYQQIISDQDNWFWFPAGTNPQDTCNPRGFYQWAVENKYRMGTTHPLEEAHQDAALLMKEKFNELVNKSIQ